MPDKIILAAIDLTDEAEEVLTAARTLAQDHSARLAVLTVIKPMTMVYGELGVGPFAGNALALETQATKDAHAKLTNLAAEYGITEHDAYVELGNPATEIRRVAEQTNATTIVIGTHARHGLGRLLGSTANAVLHGVPCDVLVVRIHPIDVHAG